MFDGWAEQLHQSDPQRFGSEALLGLRRRMFENDLTFMCMTESEVEKLDAPMLILDGADTYHPASSSQRLAELQPQAMRLHEWKQSSELEAAADRFLAFFHDHL